MRARDAILAVLLASLALTPRALSAQDVPTPPAEGEGAAPSEGETGDGSRGEIAPPPEPEAARLEEAQALFRRGLALGEQGQWADALEHFRRSHARVERPSTLYNIGLALARLGRFVEAIEVLDRVLAEPGLPAAARAEAERLRSEGLSSLGEVTLSITPADAVLYVDGFARNGSGASRVIPLDPGRHVLRATAPEHDEAELTVSVVAGEHDARELVLTPRIVEPPPPPSPAPPPPGVDLLAEPWFWVVGGVVVIGIGVGVGVGVALGNEPPPPYGGTAGVILLAP
jgi:hypothetical protein